TFCNRPVAPVKRRPKAVAARLAWVVDAVMPRQPLVDKGVIAVDKLQDAAVVAHDFLEEQLRFLDHRRPETVAEFREQFTVWRVCPQRLQLQPLNCEILDER